MQAGPSARTGQLDGPEVASRLISLGLVAAAILLLEPLELLTLIVVLGQGHFLAAYSYQAKAGQIGWRFLVAWALGALLIFGLFFLYPNFLLLVQIASIYFVVHFLQDEVFLLGEEPSLQRGLDLLPILCVGAGLVLDLRVQAMPTAGSIPYPSLFYPGQLGSTLTQVLVACGAVAVLVNAGLHLAGRIPWRGSALYFHAGSAFVFGLYFSGIPMRL